MTDRFSGDVAVKITPNGAEMLIIGGQPVMDQGFHNAALISAATEPGWWGNVLETDPARKIGSEYLQELKKPIVDIESVENLQNALKIDFQWMIDKNIAQQIEPVVTNPQSNTVFAQIKVSPQGQDMDEILLLTNGANWEAQINDPVSERMKDV